MAGAPHTTAYTLGGVLSITYQGGLGNALVFENQENLQIPSLTLPFRLAKQRRELHPSIQTLRQAYTISGVAMSTNRSPAASAHMATHRPQFDTHTMLNVVRWDMRVKDTLAERLRRRPAKPMGSPRVGSNPTGVV